MKHKFPIFSLLSFSLVAAGSQVASHAPTAFPQPTVTVPAAAKESMTPADRPVARVNGAVLTNSDLVREEYAIFPYARQHNGLPNDLEPQIRDGAMKMIIFEELVYQEALRRKITVPAAKLQHAEAQFRQQFSSPEEFNALFQSEFHGSEQLLQAKIRRSLLIDVLLKSEVENKSTVSPTELRDFYDKHPGQFEHPESFTFQTISVIPPAKATAEQLKEGHKRAEDALRRAKLTTTAEEFGMLAEKISEDDYRVMMGQHKPIPASELAPQVLKALATMKPGDISDVIQVEQISTIVRLGEHTPAGKAKFEDVKTKLEKALQQKKSNELRAALGNKLRQNAKVEEL